MKKQAVFVIFIGILSIVLIAGCTQKEPAAPTAPAAPETDTPVVETQPQQEEEQKVREGKTYATLAEIKAEQTPMKCTWTTPQGGSGMARIFGDFMRTESMFGGNTFYMTDDGVYRYAWTKGSGQGTKIRTDLQKKMEAEAGNEKIRGEYYCINEAIPDEGFAPREGINYVDVGASY